MADETSDISQTGKEKVRIACHNPAAWPEATGCENGRPFPVCLQRAAIKIELPYGDSVVTFEVPVGLSIGSIKESGE